MSFNRKPLGIKTILKSIISKTGYQIVRRVKPQLPVQEEYRGRYQVDGLEFDFVTPYATYAPWYQDAEFMETYSKIKNHTLVDIFRCHELWEIAGTIHNLDNSASFIEVGVWRGGTAAIIAKKLSILQARNSFYLADTFKGVVKASDKDFSYNGGEHADTSIEIVKELLDDKYDNLKIIVGIFPDETAHLIDPGEKFGFCHIDVDVYESAKDIVDWIWKRLIPGGIIVFDDYGFSSCTGIIKYVNEQKKLNDRIILHNLNGHAIMIKVH